ncbi:MAG: tRNA threonylcarbamoyladenosine dehydratase, partial [Ruminococcus sp.]|nr:tRNA threonylcarbamoyladenosine dehydratase [Ruminococcus sp.]
MQEQFERTELLFGSDAMETLKKSRVAVFGIGGVGGHTAEALVRSGIGAIDLIDNDEVCISNINRQIFATVNTVGQLKTASAMKRLLDINPECKITVHNIFFMPETSDMIDFSQYDYVVDAIDTVTGKIEIIMRSEKAAVPVISSMGAGNKLDPTAFEVSDIYKT